MDYEKILVDSLTGLHYYTNKDLRMDKRYGYLLNTSELNEYIKFKENYDCDSKIILNLKSFNSEYIYLYNSNELKSYVSDYFTLTSNNNAVIKNNYDEIILSRVASELDGTLKIEGVNTTRKKILDIISKKKVNDNNEQIVANMYEGFEFIKSKPEFNQDNLLKLYKILTYNCLAKEDITKEYYRDSMVVIGGHDACPCNEIKTCMDSLFEYVNKNIGTNQIYLPFIVHYYMVYIHPYFDYNGRTARMCSLWISYLYNMEDIWPTFISEAINDDKSNYYKAIEDTWNSKNDLTYFLTYIYNLSINYHVTYMNIERISEKLALEGEFLTTTELYYLKRIVINSKSGWFTHKGFTMFSHSDMTKQGALKILNYFHKLNILKSKTNSRNEKVFILNDYYITYEYNITN